MRRSTHRVPVVLFLVALTGCGQESTPGSPSPPRSFLEGVWTGTLTIEREDAATTSGATTWTFEAMPGTNLQSFNVRIQSQHAFLPITATVLSQITPGNTPPARISTQGTYPSPRGCAASLLSVGMAETRTIDADFSGVDCPSLQHPTFTGRVQLTKSGS
jgi:hypothetical protein